MRDASDGPVATSVNEETNAGCWGGCGARPGGLACFLDTYGWSQRRGAQAPRAAAPRVVPVEVAKAVKKRAGAARGARHRHHDRQRRDQAAASTARSSASISPTARASSRAICCSCSTAARSRPRSSGRGGHRGAEAQLEQAPARRRALHRAGRQERHHPGHTQQRQTQVASRARCQVQQGDAGEPEGPAQLFHDPRADLRPHRHGRVKVGNVVRVGRLAPIATIIQTAPIYVSFPSRSAAAGRADALAEAATVEADRSGRQRRASGAGRDDREHGRCRDRHGDVRATMPNKDEMLWPGTLVNTHLKLRSEEA